MKQPDTIRQDDACDERRWRSSLKERVACSADACQTRFETHPRAAPLRLPRLRRVACFPTRGVLADALASPDTTVHTHSGRDMYYPCNDVFVVLYVKPHLL